MDREFRDRDYIETMDNLFFAVIGNVHPKDRVLAYLKYLPNPRGKWVRTGKKYARSIRYYSASNIIRTVNFLRKYYSQYVFRYEPFNIVFSAVPRERIAKHYRPEERLNELLHANHVDRLERKAIKLVSIISDESSISLDRLGVTGSILLDIHRSFSDIDLTIYGRDQTRRVKEALLSLYMKNGDGLRRFSGRVLSRWCRQQSSAHPITIQEARELYARTWNKAVFRNTVFSIHAIRTEEEVTEQFGEEIYKPRGVIKVRARVVDSSDSCFLPAIYLVSDVRTTGISQFNAVERVVSYEGLYSDIAASGDEIVVKGKLEEVLDESRRLKYRRILVGSPEARGSDFMKVIG